METTARDTAASEHPPGSAAATQRSPSAHPVPALAAIVFLAAVALASLLPLRPPAVVAADAADGAFSAARAFAHLERIAAEPRPLGSPQHAEVRDYLVRQIEELGLDAEVQAETVVTEHAGRRRVARVRNVLTRLPGTAGGGALLLVSHYDSVPHSPGASDAGACVVALLETLRALRAGPPLARDVIFLFSDGEERGLLGAGAFQRYHPWAADVELVLNFEARGARGPSIMFEAGPGTGPLMGRMAALAPRPVASSFSDAVYRRLPNDTDFTIFQRAGRPGFNFAYIGDVAAYHTTLDTLARIDRRSLQHHGDYALSLARGFGDLDVASLAGGGPAIYFNLPLLGLVVYPASWTWPLLALACLLAGLALWRAAASGRAPVGRIVAGFTLAVLAPVAATVVVLLLARGAGAAMGGFPASPPTYRLGLMLVALAAAGGFLQWAARRLGVLAVSAGALPLWAVLAIVASLYALPASYLMIWPLLFAALAVLVGCRAGDGGGVAALLLAAPAVLLWVPTAFLIGDALADGAGVALGAIVGLAATCVVPQLAACAFDKRRWLAPAVALVAGLGLCGVQALTAGYDARRPRPISLFYALDADGGSALWASWDRRIDPWVQRFLGERPERQSMERFLGSPLEAWVADAPAAALAAPRAVELSPAAEPAGGEGEPAADETSESGVPADGGRTLRLRVDSPRRGAALLLDLRSESSIAGLTIDGRAADVDHEDRPDGAPAGFWRTWIFGLGEHALELEVTLSGPRPLEVALVDVVYELPEVPGAPVEPRPAGLRPHSYGVADSSLVRRSYVF